MKQKLKKILFDLIFEALMTDGAHHKQWYLERILELLVPKNENIEKTRDRLGWEEGIAP